MSVSLHQGVLHKYVNPVFIETGAYLGGGIEAAIAEEDFSAIYSIELDPKYYEHCLRYAGCRDKRDRVKLILGDSAVELPKLLATINQRCTFWLDAHYNGEREPGQNCPVLRELEAIAAHPIKSHTIMIDDRFTFDTAAFDGIRETQLHALLRKINPNYNFVYEDGALKNSVIVAVLP